GRQLPLSGDAIMMDYAVFLEGMSTLEEVEKIKGNIIPSAYRAINASADRARKLGADEIRSQINFPGSYLRGADSRLTVTKRASAANLEAVVTGRRRATSLARFIVGSP